MNKIILNKISNSIDLWGGFCICLTNKCNLSCKYCSRNCNNKGRDSLPFNTVKAVIDFFYKKTSIGKKSIQFTGGEIFLHDRIDDIIEYALCKGFTCQLQSNGILIPQAIKRRPDLFSNPNVIFKISLDGWNKDINGLYRGLNSFELTVNGIISAKSINKTVGIKTVIHEGNFLNLDKMLDFCLRLKVEGWSYNILFDRGRSQEKADISELAVVKKLLPLFQIQKYTHLMNGTNIQAYLLLNALGIKSLPYYFFVNGDGNIYITDNTVRERLVGNVFKAILTSEFTVSFPLTNIDLTINRQVLKYITSHIKVEIER